LAFVKAKPPSSAPGSSEQILATDFEKVRQHIYGSSAYQWENFNSSAYQRQNDGNISAYQWEIFDSSAHQWENFRELSSAEQWENSCSTSAYQWQNFNGQVWSAIEVDWDSMVHTVQQNDIECNPYPRNSVSENSAAPTAQPQHTSGKTTAQPQHTSGKTSVCPQHTSGKTSESFPMQDSGKTVQGTILEYIDKYDNSLLSGGEDQGARREPSVSSYSDTSFAPDGRFGCKSEADDVEFGEPEEDDGSSGTSENQDEENTTAIPQHTSGKTLENSPQQTSGKTTAIPQHTSGKTSAFPQHTSGKTSENFPQHTSGKTLANPQQYSGTTSENFQPNTSGKTSSTTQQTIGKTLESRQGGVGESSSGGSESRRSGLFTVSDLLACRTAGPSSFMAATNAIISKLNVQAQSTAGHGHAYSAKEQGLLQSERRLRNTMLQFAASPRPPSFVQQIVACHEAAHIDSHNKPG